MKKLLCSDLGGPADCQFEFQGNSMSEIGMQSKNHVMDMVEKHDEAHKAAIERMQGLSPEEQQKEFDSYIAKFEAAPEV